MRRHRHRSRHSRGISRLRGLGHRRECLGKRNRDLVARRSRPGEREHRRLGVPAGVRQDVGQGRVQHVLDHVHDPVGDQDVGVEDLAGVDVPIVPGERDADVDRVGGTVGPAQRGPARGVVEVGAVENPAQDDVVGEDVPEFGRLQRRQGACGELERGVPGREDGDVPGPCELVDKAGLVQRGEEGSQVRVVNTTDRLETGRWCHHRVDYVDQAVGEGDFSLDYGRARVCPRGEYDLVVALVVDDDALATGDVCGAAVLKEGRDKDWDSYFDGFG